MTYEIAIAQTDFPGVETERQVFESAGDNVTVTAGSPDSEAELVDLASGTDGLVVQYAHVSASVLEQLPELSVVSRYGIGVDNIDVEAASAHDVAITHVPSYCEEEVATHAIALLLTLTRKTSRYDREIKSGSWDWKIGRPIDPLVGKTIGFAAFGKIPRKVTELLQGFDLEYLVHDPYLSDVDVANRSVELVSFETMLAESDVVSIHTPLVEETRHLFDAEAFSRMKESALLINTARGPVVDESALNDALQDGEIAGAGLDVMAEEPTHESPLFAQENTVISPHVGWYSESSLTELRRKAAENVVRYLNGADPHGFVNASEISSPQR